MGLGLLVVVVSVVEPLVARIFQYSDYLLSGACNKDMKGTEVLLGKALVIGYLSSRQI